MASRPILTAAEAATLADELFGVDGSVDPLPGEWDQAFCVAGTSVLRVSRAGQSREHLEAQNRVLAHLDGGTANLATPQVVAAADGTDIAEASVNGDLHLVRMLEYIDGAPVVGAMPLHPAVLAELGRAIGELSVALSDTPVEHVPTDFPWDLRRAAIEIEGGLDSITPGEKRDLVARVAGRHTEALDRVVAEVPVGVIHGDANEHNLLLRDSTRGTRLGLIDFGDLRCGIQIEEPAVALAYATFGLPDPLAGVRSFLSGYAAVRPVTEAEAEALFPLICLRLCVSVVTSARQSAQQPDNDYLLVSEAQAWESLQRLDEIDASLAHAHVRSAVGLEPVASSTKVRSWLDDNSAVLVPAIELIGPAPKVIDWSVAGSPVADATDMAALADSVTEQYAIGRYLEPRLVYDGSEFVEESNDGAEARTVHLGLDLFAPPGTPIRAPLAGTVADLSDNRALRDYGPAVLLRHAPNEELEFWSLYGHLDSDSLSNLDIGDVIAAGAEFAAVGQPPQNGGWPPHAHLQLITDLADASYPGAARPSEVDIWQSLSPNPSLLAGIAAEHALHPRIDEDELLASRARYLPASYSMAYSESSSRKTPGPLTAVRGRGTILYDQNGRAHLDCVNNIAHVGHEHPRVVAALQSQAAILNTNSRYPHPLRVQYLQRLAELLPSPLEVVFLVGSGSEANDLALRIARTVTGRTAVMAVDHAYHGHTQALIDVSPYKHRGPGGAGTPADVHIVPMADPYRSPHGANTADHLGDFHRVLDDVDAPGPAAFIAESVLGCGGQVVHPDGYLAAAFDAVRAAGGLTIADEVQVGFGRIGTHFWAFQAQGASPDIVTMGKPMGNGHPLAAVATTRDIAESFANGMEYFNSFGGNPVSCAVGLAVLDVIVDEGLQRHALDVGSRLSQSLRELGTEFPLIGDVRGSGLFLGVELVADRQTKEPAPRQARYLVERCRERAVLLSLDGPHGNVLKIKPPMSFSTENAEELCRCLELVLRERGAQPAAQ